MPTSDLNPTAHRQIAIWLLAVCGLLFAMVVLGGVTRLTRSGLSMVEWAPLMGIIPPLTEMQWLETFTKYQAFPEYRHVNQGMDLAGFKSIFWFEYSHRLLGRSIGLAFFLPFLYFLFRRMVSKALWPKLVAMFVLGGLQGLLGWYMVKSGLIDVPQVSQYRLTAHLSLAIAIYGYMLWVALGLLLSDNSYAGRETAIRLRPYAISLMVLIGIMIISGGFVAGTKAGFAYSTFPTMDGSWFPTGLYQASPWYRNLFEQHTTVQFNHRLLAYLIVAAVIALTIIVLRSVDQKLIRYTMVSVLAAMFLQVALGISTILTHVSVPIAAAHQAGALIFLTTTTILMRLVSHSNQN